MEIKKAVTFRASSIGDCLMGKYLLENIHTAYPEARLGLVVASRGEMIRDLFAAYPWLDVYEVNRRNPGALFTLLKNFSRSDVVVTQYTGGLLNLSTKIVARLLARRGGLVGFRDLSTLNHYLYDHLLPLPIRDRSVRLHECDALAVFDVSARVGRLSLNYLSIAGIAEKFGIRGPYAIVHLFSGSKSRGLSTAHMRELLVALTTEMPGVTLVLSGGVADAAEAIEASAGLPAVVIAGRATLQELMNLISETHVCVSLDTGVGHLAAHLGRPPVIMSTCLGRISWWGADQYGPGIPAVLFTRADLCVAGHVFKPYPECLASIDMQEVARAVKTLIV